jgi:cell division septum initiation protein DivIVA
MHKRSIAIGFGCAVLLATGCATSGTVETLEERVGALEQRVDETERRAAAAQAAETAAAEARNAAAQASDSTRRADAMFSKSVNK